MALLWIDGFESYGTAISIYSGPPSPPDVVARRYAMADSDRLRVQEGRFGGRSLYANNSSVESLRTPSLTTDTTLIVGAAFQRRGSSIFYIHRLFDNHNLGINISGPSDATGLLILNGATVLETVQMDMKREHWYFIELKVVAHETTGSYEVRVDGKTVAQATNIDTKAGGGLGYYNQVGFNSTGASGSRLQIDDLYICDGSGSLNNDFLGPKHVVAIRPVADHAANFTTVEPAGDHYAAVNEEACDDDTSYVEGGDGDKDLYEYEDLPAGLKNIKGLQVHTMTRVTGTNHYDLKTVVLSDATEDADAGQFVASPAWVLKSRIVEEDPDTSALWLPAAIDAARFGLLAEDA